VFWFTLAHGIMIALVAAAAGWLCLFMLVTAASAAARRAVRAALLPGDESPAVVGLLAGRPDMQLYQASLLDLSARGWFRLSQTGPARAGSAARRGSPGAGPVMCELAAEQPRDALTPYERQALAHVAFRAGARDEVPAPALSDGFQEGEDTFLAGFRREVVAESRRRGLSQPRLGVGTRALLCVAALLPAGAAIVALQPHQRPGGALFIGIAFLVVCGVVAGLGAHEVPSRAGHAALAGHRARQRTRGGQHAGGLDRGEAYAAALGLSSAATVTFQPSGKDEMWSGYGGRWRPVTIGSPLENPMLGWAGILYICFGFPVLSVLGVLGFAGVVHGSGGAGLRAGALAVVCGGAAVFSLAILRWIQRPSLAEFHGQVIKRWIIPGDDDSPSHDCVAIDDGTSPRSWAFSVSSRQYQILTPGTFVYVRANPRRNKLLSIESTEPPATAPRLADIAAAQQHADGSGLPDPALLVTEQEAAGIFGYPVRGTRVDLIGRMVVWRPVTTSRPSLQIMVEGGALGAKTARLAAARGQHVPADNAWLLGSGSAVVRAEPLTSRITLTGLDPAAAEAAMARLVPEVARRLRAAAP